MNNKTRLKNITIYSKTYGSYILEYIGTIDLVNNNLEDVIKWTNKFHPRKLAVTVSLKSIKPGILAIWIATERVNPGNKRPPLMTDKELKKWIKNSKDLMIK